MGISGSVDENSSFHFDESKGSYEKVSKFICAKPNTLCYRIEPTLLVYLEVLVKYAARDGITTKVQHNFSFADRRIVREDYSDLGGYGPSLRIGFPR